MKKIIFITLSTVLINFFLMTSQFAYTNTAIAANETINPATGSNTGDNNELVEGTFPVQQILALPSYTDEKNKEHKVQNDVYINNDKNISPIEALVVRIIDYALKIMGSIGMILIIIAGFFLITARGDSSKIDEAKEMIEHVAMGLVVAFLAYIILLFVQSLFVAT